MAGRTIRSLLGLRDPLSGLTHCLGAAVGVVCLCLLMVRAATVVHVVSFAVFGAGMILLYLFSTLYHWVPYGEVRTRRLRKCDHIMICVFIAASYTPVCLVALPGAWGWSLFGVVWGLAVAGTVVKLFWLGAPRWLSTGFYIAMGWAAAVGFPALFRALSPAALTWLVAGGLCYTVGGVVYGLKRPNPWPEYFGFHEVFHVFVLAGSGCHFWLMYEHLARMA